MCGLCDKNEELQTQIKSMKKIEAEIASEIRSLIYEKEQLLVANADLRKTVEGLNKLIKYIKSMAKPDENLEDEAQTCCKLIYDEIVKETRT